MPNWAKFLFYTAVMTAVAVCLFLVVLRRSQSNVYLLVLVGIVLGTFLRSLTALLATVMDPGEYLVVADLSTASFATVNTESLGVAIILAALALGFAWWRAPYWDVLATGPDVATGLGLNYRREVRLALSTAAVLVASATALTGPLMFFGLLVVNIAHFTVTVSRLRDLLVASCALAVLVLVGGQAILEHVLNQSTILPVVLEFAGGFLLLAMIIRGSSR